MDSRTQPTERGYAPPEVTDLGSLTELTHALELRHVASIATMGVAFATSVAGNTPDPTAPLSPDPSAPFAPEQHFTPTGGGGGGGGGGGASALPTTHLDPGTGAGGGNVAGETMTTGTDQIASTPASGTGGVSGGGGASAGGTAAGGGGSLPFTGYTLSLVAGAGMTMAAAGKLLRRAARR